MCKKLVLCLCINTSCISIKAGSLYSLRQLLMYLEIFQYTSIRNLLHMQSNQFLFSWVVASSNLCSVPELIQHYLKYL